MEEQKVRRHFRLLISIGALAVAACGGGQSGEAANGEASSGGESDYAGPIASTDVAHGKEVFDSLCGDCHPDGGSDVGPSLIESPHTPAQLRQQVREGSGKMRPFSEGRLSKDDLESVLAWLASVNAVK
ncbi:MAG TPA: cytochrome c [Polyangiales bacterium]|nr:cytochrome c [Polyangiales bacterium]